MRQELTRILRFLIAGAVNTAFGYAVYALLVLAGLPAQAALLLAFVIGVAFNYFTTARFVFATRGFDRLPAYIAVYVCIYAGNALALHLATTSGVAPLLAQALIVPVTAAVTYIAMRMVFAERAAAGSGKQPD
jgi:putative flippase GtrA